MMINKKILFLLPVIFICGCCCRAPKESKYVSYKIGAVPNGVIHQMDDHNGSLYYWMEAYAHKLIPGGLTLVHVDAHEDDRCGALKTEEASKKFLKDFIATPVNKRRDFFFGFANKGEIDKNIDIENFIIPAMKMGIIERFVWIKPNFNAFDKNPLYKKNKYSYFMIDRPRVMSCDYCFEAASELFEDNCSINNFELNSLPPISGPVLLDIDMDAFGNRSTKERCRLYFTPDQIRIMIDELFLFLSKWSPDVYVVTIADSPGEFSTSESLSQKPYLLHKLSH